MELTVTRELVVVFVGLIWGLHLMTRAQDYRKIKERFERTADKYQQEKFSKREALLKVLGFVMTAVCLYYFYDILYQRPDAPF